MDILMDTIRQYILESSKQFTSYVTYITDIIIFIGILQRVWIKLQ